MCKEKLVRKYNYVMKNGKLYLTQAPPPRQGKYICTETSIIKSFAFYIDALGV